MKQSIRLQPIKKNIKTRSHLKYHVKTFGCQMNEYDSGRVARILESDGMSKTNELQDADLLYINTCTIRENADNKLYGTLGELKNWKENDLNRKLIVGGCASQKDKELVRKKAPWVDVVLGTNNIGNLLDLIEHAESIGPVTEIDNIFDDSMENFSSINETTSSGMITIQIGCNNACSFCIVPSVRGPEKSRRPLDIYEDAVELAESGIKEILLLGQNVNSYGRDLKIENKHSPYFVELLNMISEIDGIERIRFISPHPKDVNKKLLDTININEKICNHIHLPLQSGSDKILFDMKRGYTQKKYLEKVEIIKNTSNTISITTDVIVGFPGETDKDFQSTLDVINKVKFDSIFMYKFSARPGTVAGRMNSNFVDKSVIDNRFNILKNVQTLISEKQLSRYVGTNLEVLVEGPSKNNPMKSSGRSDANHIVILNKLVQPSSIINCKISNSTPYILYGEVL